MTFYNALQGGQHGFKELQETFAEDLARERKPLASITV